MKNVCWNYFHDMYATNKMSVYFIFCVFFYFSRPLSPSLILLFCDRTTPIHHESSALSRDISWQHRDMADRNPNGTFHTTSFTIIHRVGISFHVRKWDTT